MCEICGPLSFRAARLVQGTGRLRPPESALLIHLFDSPSCSSLSLPGFFTHRSESESMNWQVYLHQRFKSASRTHTPQLAKIQTSDSPGSDDSFQRNPSLSDMLNEMATHSRRIQDRISLEAHRPRTTARTTTRNVGHGSPSLPSQESVIHSLYATPTSSPDYSVIAYNHRFPQNAIQPQRRSPRRRYRPPPTYSKTDPNASISVTLSEMGLCVRGDTAPQLPPPYSSESSPPGSPTPTSDRF